MNYENPIYEKLFILICLIAIYFGLVYGFKNPQYEQQVPVYQSTGTTKGGETRIDDTKLSTPKSKSTVSKHTTLTINKDNSAKIQSTTGLSGDIINQSLLNAGVYKDMIGIVRKVGKEYKIHPYYIAIVGLAENIRNPWAIGDNGCSYGAYQFNKCPGNRDEQIRFGKKFENCIKDYECSTKMLAEKIRSAYKCKVDDNGYIEKFYECLPLHNGTNYKQRYVDKLVKANQILFTMGG